jgi:hypothetical protein
MRYDAVWIGQKFTDDWVEHAANPDMKMEAYISLKIR